jgi:hypothetical protein
MKLVVRKVDVAQTMTFHLRRLEAISESIAQFARSSLALF